jgi:DnaK suppressor protein
MNNAKLNTYKKRLLTLQNELSHILDVTEASRKPVELDQTSVGRLSRMNAMQAQAMQLETGRRRKQELQRIDNALKRIESGDFGYCASCDEEIQEKRLYHDPTFPTCIGCAQSGY